IRPRPSKENASRSSCSKVWVRSCAEPNKAPCGHGAVKPSSMVGFQPRRIAGTVHFGGNAPGRAGPLVFGAAEGIRTPDPRITNAVLYRLSYSGAGRDLEQNASDYAICGLTA